MSRWTGRPKLSSFCWSNGSAFTFYFPIVVNWKAQDGLYIKLERKLVGKGGHTWAHFTHRHFGLFFPTCNWGRGRGLFHRLCLTPHIRDGLCFFVWTDRWTLEFPISKNLSCIPSIYMPHYDLQGKRVTEWNISHAEDAKILGICRERQLSLAQLGEMEWIWLHSCTLKRSFAATIHSLSSPPLSYPVLSSSWRAILSLQEKSNLKAASCWLLRCFFCLR